MGIRGLAGAAAGGRILHADRASVFGGEYIWRHKLTPGPTQRQTVVSQFYQLDRLVVEGGMSVSPT